MLPVLVMTLSVVLTTPCLLFHIPLFIFLIQLYLLPSIQPLLRPTSTPPSFHLFLTILLRAFLPAVIFCFSCLSLPAVFPSLFVSRAEYLGAVKTGLAVYEASPPVTHLSLC